MLVTIQSLVIWLVLATSSVRGCARQSRNYDAKEESGIELQFVSEKAKDEADEKVWLFAVDGRKKPYSFLDARGQLIGFDVDLISKVCQLASKQCKMVLAEFPECAYTYRDFNVAGRGLMAGWFDGCSSYTNSVDRKAAFDFTDPYIQTSSSFAVLPNNPSGFDPKLADFSNFVLTHLTGAVSNAKCLNRLGKTFNQIIIAKDLPDALNLLMNKTADVLFSPRNVISGLSIFPERLHCEKGGAGIMTKKGSELSSWWNPAFRSMVSSGQFAQFCRESEAKFQATFKCLTSPAPTPAVLPVNNDDNKTWLFSVSGRRKPFNYFDGQGQLVGFDLDLIQAVCGVAGKKCDVLVGDFTECTFTNRNINYPGRGLMDNWFDACPGYVNSLDRENSFDFTDAYLKSSSTFSVLPNNPSGFNPNMSDYSNFTFTHLTGAYTNAECLKRIGKTAKNIVLAANLPDAKRILLSREADVLFSPRRKIADLLTFPLVVHCELTGTSVMAKKGSPLVSWWNGAFETFVQQGGYKKLCADSIRKYSFPIRCFDASNFAHVKGIK